MKIMTKYHGDLDITINDIWKFDQGIPGFVDEREFILLPLPQIEGFQVLQSVATPHLGFVVTDPFQFFKDYDFTLNASILEQLELTQDKDVQVLTILTVKDPITNTTANLQAPIILNTANQKGKQVILNETDYQTKHFIFNRKMQKVKG
ncbi:flagellar assembly protein FliW [Bacillus salacetis]|uniref:Flagellar assembly factor FliW n=1 Tax=Bacillus salacetis TaxID=2315464 RepID=A0A3A1R765_9BACI|nr:flagellar assembly protein FliW [Bacillus salacetis]RIW39061.1 flagellar assembly protein FliW [Bacillus salacetis]